jgi:hypothetical protein
VTPDGGKWQCGHDSRRFRRMRGCGVIGHGLSTMMARKSFTLV